jgi:hypothetical protein
VNKLKQIQKKKPLAEINVIKRLVLEEKKNNSMIFSTCFEIKKAVIEFLKEVTDLKEYDYLSEERPMGPLGRSFRFLQPIKKWFEHEDEKDVEIKMFEGGMKFGKMIITTRNAERAIKNFVKIGLFPAVEIFSKGKKWLVLSPELQRDTAWKVEWYLRYLINQTICGKEIDKSLNFEYFQIPKYLLEEAKKALKVVNKLKYIDVPEWLWKRFKETSKSVGREVILEPYKPVK